MTRRLFFYAFLILPSSVFSQDTVAGIDVFLHEVNRNISLVGQGYFESSCYSKSAFKEDTTHIAARIYFFRNTSDQDSICSFAAVLDQAPWKAYDGTLFYRVNPKDSTILAQPVAEKGGVKNFLATGAQDRLAFRPYIFGPEKTPFPLSKFANALADTLYKGKDTLLILTVLDSFPNPLQAASIDPPVAYSRAVYTFSWSRKVLLKKQEWIIFSDSPQYGEIYLSPIYPLPDSVTFRHVFNLDSLRKTGYEYIDKVQPSPNAKKLIVVGDTLPAVVLPDLAGNPVRFWETDRQLVLLDFWYQSCAPCLQAMPAIERLHQKYGSSVLHVWGVNPYNRDGSQIRDFMKRREVTYSSLLDSDKKMVQELGITGYPTLIIAQAKSRKILFVQVGFAPEIEQELLNIIEQHK